MRVEIEAFKATTTADEVWRLLDRFAARDGLECRAIGAIARQEGSGHWHLRRTRRRGTLEISFLPLRGVVVIEVRSNRIGEWTADGFRGLEQFLRDATTRSL